MSTVAEYFTDCAGFGHSGGGWTTRRAGGTRAGTHVNGCCGRPGSPAPANAQNTEPTACNDIVRHMAFSFRGDALRHAISSTGHPEGHNTRVNYRPFVMLRACCIMITHTETGAPHARAFHGRCECRFTVFLGDRPPSNTQNVETFRKSVHIVIDIPVPKPGAWKERSSIVLR